MTGCGACFLSLVVWTASAANLREELLGLANKRIEVFYADPGNLDDPKTQDGITFRLSKKDKACGDAGVPISFVEFDVKGVRPVDVFNVMADSVGQCKWDSHCSSMKLLVDDADEQARGLDGVFSAPAPLSSREAYEWQVFSANFSSEEFWVVFSTLENDKLKQIKPPSSGAVQMENCLAAYRITKTESGAHVVNTQQINSHPYPLKARTVANMAWEDSVAFSKTLSNEAQKQESLGWNDTEVTVPDWLLEDRPCGAPVADTHLKESLLQRAVTELNRTGRGPVTNSYTLPNGQPLSIWRDWASCGSTTVPASQVPVWYSEFIVPDVVPAEVFNALVAKKSESSWNHALRAAEVANFSRGARGVHEEFVAPTILGHTWDARELWEWQVASHSFETGKYLVALASMDGPAASRFGPNSVEALQCLAAYELSNVGNGTKVRSTSNLNPNVGLLSHLTILWEGSAERMIADFGASLTTEAQRIKANRGKFVGLDGDALRLLSPPALNSTNATATLEEVASVDQRYLLRDFRTLDLPLAINSTDNLTFTIRSLASLELFRRLKTIVNVTATQAGFFAQGEAKDPIILQAQGELLAEIQQAVIVDWAAKVCNGQLPDIDGNKGAGGLSERLVIGLGVAAVCALATCSGFCCVRGRRKWRQRRAQEAATALLGSDLSLSRVHHAAQGQPYDSSKVTGSSPSLVSGSLTHEPVKELEPVCMSSLSMASGSTRPSTRTASELMAQL